MAKENIAALSEEERFARVRSAGNQLVTGIHSLLRAAAMHEMNNRSLDRPSEMILESVEQLQAIENAPVSLNISQGVAYLNAHRLRLDATAFSFAQNLEGSFSKWDSSGLRFERDIDLATVRNFFYFLARYRSREGDKEALQTLIKALKEQGLAGIAPSRRMVLALDEQEKQVPGALALKTYAKVVAALGRLLEQEPMPHSLTQRLVQDLADALEQEGDLLLGLALAPATAIPWPRRMVNITVLTLALARALDGCSRASLSELGYAALTHSLPQYRRAKRESELARAGGLPALQDCLQELLVPAALTSPGMRGFVAALEQAKRPDGGGPPPWPVVEPPLLGSQLVRLAGEIQRRVYPPAGGYAPYPEVAASLLLDAPEMWSPELRLLLLKAVGLYPAGQVLELESGEIAVVVAASRAGGPGPAAAQGGLGLKVRLLRDARGAAVRGYETVELGAARPGGGLWRLRRVLNARDHKELGIQSSIDNPQTVLLQVRLASG